MKEERWLQKLKEQLNDYTEPTPTAVWKRLEKELPNTAKSPRAIYLHRAWRVGVAALTIGVLCLIGLHLTKILPTAGEQHTDKQTPTATINTSPTLHAEPAATLPIMAPLERLSARANRSVPSLHIPTSVVPDTLPLSKQSPTTAINTVRQPKKDTRTAKKRDLSEPDSPLLALDKRVPSRNKGWAISLSAGNAGGFRTKLDNSGIQNLQQNAPGTGFTNIDFTNASNGIVAIPQGQEIVFKDGLPYLKLSRRRIIAANHKQPISAGISVRKNLSKGFSIETGLVYTLLISDLSYENSTASVRQKLHYLGLPLRTNWNFIDKKDFTFYLSAGGMIEKCIYGKIGTNKETIDPVQWSILTAVGAQYNVSKHVGIYVEPGMSYYFDDGSDAQTIRKENPCNFTLQAGLRLSY